MAAIQYRLFFDNTPATRPLLDSVEAITVEQEMDMAWEARLQIPLCVDQQGRWQGESEGFMRDFARVRVEIKVGNGTFTPLIDGPVVGRDSARSSEPGQSQITLIVHDDSVYLNREEDVERYENRTDGEVAQQLFDTASQIASTEIDQTAPPQDNLTPEPVRRGTAMQMLRTMAREHGMHAYVLPGDTPGASVGCFKRPATRPSGLPPLILLGPERNVEQVNVSSSAQTPATTRAFALSVTDKVTASSTSSFRDVDLLGESSTLEDESSTGTELARPGPGSRVAVERRAAARTERSSYAIEAEGTAIGACYTGVLVPYNVVTVQAINDRLSGDYLIRRVTHTLTRSTYRQAFGLKRNARSSGSDGLGDLIGSIF